MSIQLSDLSSAANRLHQSNLVAAEATKSAAQVPGASQAIVRAADIAYHRAALASAIANKCSTDAFVDALRVLTGGNI